MKNENAKTSVSLTAMIIGSIFLILPLMGFLLQDEKKWTAPAAADKMKNAVAADAKSIAAGKKIFDKECTKCHGKKGDGKIPKDKLAELGKDPGDFTKEDFQKQSDGAIYWKMTEGKKPMPSFKKEFSDNDRWALVNYLRELGKTTAEPEKKN